MLFQHIRHVDYLDVWMHDGATEMIRDQADWVTPLCVKEHYGVEATFVHVDKDMAEIAMAKKSCSHLPSKQKTIHYTMQCEMHSC